MIRKWNVSLLIIIALFQITPAARFCNIPENNLKLQYRKGYIRPSNYPYNFSGGQHCTWSLPNNEFPERALFLFIEEVDLIDEQRNRNGDLKIGEGKMFSLMPEANCRLYGQNLSDIDVVALINFTTHKHGDSGRFCNAWHINSKPLENIVFRTYGEKEAIHKKKFFIRFDYVSVQRENAGNKDSGIPTASTKAMTQPNGASDDERKNVAAESSSTTVTRTSNANCGSSLTVTAAIAALAFLLAITCCGLIYVICRSRQAEKHTTPTVVVAARPELPPSDQDHSNAAYASIGESVTLALNSATPKFTSPMYDVPTNNRPRAPTAVSCVSTLSEHHYQHPNSLFVMAEEAETPQQLNVESKDVYAVVNKNPK